MSEWILLALAPVFLAFVAGEAWYWRGRRDIYDGIDTLSNASLALMHQAADAIAWLALTGLFFWVHRYRLFDWPDGAATLAALFLAQDFCYYWFHRASHRVRWLWAAHVTHHSSPRLNFSTAFRQSLTYPISGMWLFWLPLAWLGFDPHQIIAVVAINLAFQFFVHTQAIGRLGFIEWVFNTPSHHRVHHARNAAYIDRNYAGVLIVWDRWFGTYVDEDPAQPCEYGIVHPIDSHNPLVLSFHEWQAMFADMLAQKSLRQRLVQLFGPPEKAAARARTIEGKHASADA